MNINSLSGILMKKPQLEQSQNLQQTFILG
jgi:hypothetical protein